MTDEDLKKWCALADAATAGPWEASNHQTHLGEDNVELAWWTVCAVRENGQHIDLIDVQWSKAANGAFIAAARTAVPALIDEVERLRSRPWELLRDLGYEVDETGVCRGRVMEREIVALRAALTETLDIFDRAWCPEHGHAPKLVVFERVAELRKKAQQ